MTGKERLYYLIENYYNKNYDINTFVDEFCRIYRDELMDSDCSNLEIQIFSELDEICGRFSNYETDEKIAKIYYNENDVNKKINEVIKILNIK